MRREFAMLIPIITRSRMKISYKQRELKSDGMETIL